MAAPRALIPMGPLSALQEYRKNLLLSGEYSDMQIVCQGVRFNVHRCIVCPPSPFFTDVFKHPCESDFLEDDLKNTERVISYLYLRDYIQDGHIIPMHTDRDESASSPPNIGFNIGDVYIAADKFGITPLISVAAARMADWTKNSFRSQKFIDMGHHILQLAHDPWPCQFIADCIANHRDILTNEDHQVFQLVRASGLLGLATLKAVVKESEASHSHDTQCLKKRTETLKVENAGLTKQVKSLQKERTSLQKQTTDRQLVPSSWDDSNGSG